jgi:hypothetical protein
MISRLDFKTGLQDWTARPEFKTGLQDWTSGLTISILLANHGICFALKLLLIAC